MKSLYEARAKRFEKKLPPTLKKLFNQFRSFPLCCCILFLTVAVPSLEFKSPFWGFITAAILMNFVAGAALFLRPSHRWFILFGVACTSLLTLLTWKVLIGGSAEVTAEKTGVAVAYYTFALIIEVAAFALLIAHSMMNKAASAVDRVVGSIGGYLLLALIWSTAFSLVLEVQPEAVIDGSDGKPLEKENVLYYSIVTQTTQGYGDIVPKSRLARYLAAYEGMTGTLYLAVLVAGILGVVQNKITE